MELYFEELHSMFVVLYLSITDITIGTLSLLCICQNSLIELHVACNL